MEIEEIDNPILQPSEVLIKVHAVGICGSDIHGFSGKTGRRLPGMVMGHEISGEIIDLDSNVKKFKVGQKVAVQPIIYCGSCKVCMEGNTSICLNKKMIGVNMARVGGLAEYIAVPETNVFPLPQDMSYSLASLVEPFAVGISTARNSNIQQGKIVLIVGAGLIGQTILLAISEKKPKKIFIVDNNKRKLKIAEKLGAIPVDFTYQNPVEHVLKETNGLGVDIAIEAVGLTASVKTAMYATRPGGNIIWIGNSQKFIELDMQDVVTKGKSIQGVYCYSDDDFRDAIKFIDRNHATISTFVEEKVTLANASVLFAKLARNKKKLLRAVVLLKT